MEKTPKKISEELIAAHLFVCTQVSFAEHVLTVRLNRPDKRHAINKVMANELVYCLQLAKECLDVRVVVVCSEGPVFCAGADLFDMQTNTLPDNMPLPMLGGLNDIPLKMRECNKPVLVAVQGSAMAGALLLICNATHVLAAENAEFSTPEIKRGLWPFMVMAGLCRLMPPRQALDFMMRASVLNASKAQQLGLVTDVVPLSGLASASQCLANELAALPPTTLKLGLEAFYHQADLAFEEAIPYLKNKLDQTLLSADAEEGIRAFKEKRKPHWPDPS
ncbi:MAG TPA: enoyl-CoA hydratase/isomerase family protein [Pseudomonadales bacterium]|nr:enoyl-CoA hydratase/isomerase family protein [Pseudomonadales bacterium]